MKLEVSVDKLKNAVALASRIVGKNLSLPILSTILFKVSGKLLNIRSTNLSLGIEIEIPAKVFKEGVVAVSGDILNNIFSNINQNTVTLESLQGNILINSKNSNILVKSLPAEDFPTIPSVSGKTFNINSNILINGIKSVHWSALVSDIKPEISSVYMWSENGQLVFVATDSFRLAEKRIKTKNQEEIPGIILPFRNVVEIIRIFDGLDGEIKISYNKNQISFSCNGIYVTSRLIDGIYPDYRQIIPKEKTTETIVLKQDFLSALKIAGVFSGKFNQISLIARPREKNFFINSKSAEVGENHTRVDAALSGENIEVNLNLKYLMDCLPAISDDSIVIRFNGADKPILARGVSDSSFTYLIMPISPSKSETKTEK